MIALLVLLPAFLYTLSSRLYKGAARSVKQGIDRLIHATEDTCWQSSEAVLGSLAYLFLYSRMDS